MMNKVNFVSVLVFCAFAQNVFSQSKVFPDFEKAKRISYKELRCDTVSLMDWRHFKMLNACKVGSYSADLYIERNGELFKVVTVKMECIQAVGYFATFEKEELNALSTEIVALGVGHWWAKIDAVGCGWVFEFDIGSNSVTSGGYEFGCK